MDFHEISELFFWLLLALARVFDKLSTALS